MQGINSLLLNPAPLLWSNAGNSIHWKSFEQGRGGSNLGGKQQVQRVLHHVHKVCNHIHLAILTAVVQLTFNTLASSADQPSGGQMTHLTCSMRGYHLTEKWCFCVGTNKRPTPDSSCLLLTVSNTFLLVGFLDFLVPPTLGHLELLAYFI